MSEKDNLLQTPVCEPEGDKTPLCPASADHGPMKYRLAIRGPNSGRYFWGCSKFPSCCSSIDVLEPVSPELLEARRNRRDTRSKEINEPVGPPKEYKEAWDKLLKRTDRAFRFLAGLPLINHAVVVQHEREAICRELRMSILEFQPKKGGNDGC